MGGESGNRASIPDANPNHALQANTIARAKKTAPRYSNLSNLSSKSAQRKGTIMPILKKRKENLKTVSMEKIEAAQLSPASRKLKSELNQLDSFPRTKIQGKAKERHINTTGKKEGRIWETQTIESATKTSGAGKDAVRFRERSPLKTPTPNEVVPKPTTKSKSPIRSYSQGEGEPSPALLDHTQIKEKIRALKAEIKGREKGVTALRTERGPAATRTDGMQNMGIWQDPDQMKF